MSAPWTLPQALLSSALEVGWAMKMRGYRPLAAVWVPVCLAACNPREAPPAPPPPAPANTALAPAPKPATAKLIWLDAPAEGELPVLVQQVDRDARAHGQAALVYVGAAWCEPCRYFHEAALRGELDAALGQVRILAYDADRDRSRLEAAGYASRMIPLLVRPLADGRAGPRRMQGSIKGPGAVQEMLPRVQRLLTGPAEASGGAVQ